MAFPKLGALFASGIVGVMSILLSTAAGYAGVMDAFRLLGCRTTRLRELRLFPVLVAGAGTSDAITLLL